MTKYRLKEDTEARQFTPEQLGELLLWGNGYIEAEVESKIIYLAIDDRRAKYGDWVVCNDKDGFQVMTDEEFKETYVKVDDE